jgi:hypothetical protein
MASDKDARPETLANAGFSADRDHIVVGIGSDAHGPYWSTLGQNIAPVTLESALKSRAWYTEQHPEWDVRIYRIEEVK